MDGMSDVVGISLGILSGLFFALLFLCYRSIPNAERGLTISVVNFWRYAISTVLLLPFAGMLGATNLHSNDILPLIGFAVLFAVIVSGIHHIGLHKTRPLHSSILGKTEPVFGIVFALAFLHEMPSICAMIGGVLIGGSGIWLALRTRGKL
jgi:drug/metabolite transporter (DMT)-like permease